MAVSVSWMVDAACLNQDMEMFFNIHMRARAVGVCKECPVKVECLEYGLEEPDGIFGGMTPHQRSKVSRKRLKRTMASLAR